MRPPRRSWYEVRRKAGLANPIIKPHWEIKPLLRIASMILIPLFSVLLSWYYINDYTDSCKLVEYIVPMGERGELTLPDGTKVQINSESSTFTRKAFEAIHVLFIFPERRILMSIRIRNIRLLSRHLCYSVRALGTKFNIQAYSEDRKTITTLENGKVQINNLLAPDSLFYSYSR